MVIVCCVCLNCILVLLYPAIFDLDLLAVSKLGIGCRG